MELNEKTLNKNTIFKGKILNLRSDTALLPNGTTAVREVIEHSGGVCVAAIDENDNVLMVKQFRMPFNKVLLEVPAGKLNKNEDIFEAAKREFNEETGYIANKLTYMGEFYPSVGFLTEKIHIYIGEDLVKECQHLDDDEFLNVEKYNIDTLYNMVLKNEIRDSKTVIAIMLLKNYISDRK